MKRYIKKLVLFLGVVLPTIGFADFDRDGRDTFRHDFGSAVDFEGPDQNRWDDKGLGGWRTNDGHGNAILRDLGHVFYDLSHLEDDGFDFCRVICEADRQCKGIEYIAVATNEAEGVSVQDGAKTFHVSKCEVHYDAFHSCDASASVAAAARPSMFNGCWVKVR